MKRVFLPFLLLLQLFIVSCDTDDGKKDSIDCTDIACTENFVTITVTVKDRSGVIVPLDSFRVISTMSNEDLTRELSEETLEMARQSGTYPLFGDEYASRFQNESLTVFFKGFIDGNEVVSSEFRVGADCCHVQLLQGDTDIVIDE